MSNVKDLKEKIQNLENNLKDKERIIKKLEEQIFYNEEINKYTRIGESIKIYYKDKCNELLGENKAKNNEIQDLKEIIKNLIVPNISNGEEIDNS